MSSNKGEQSHEDKNSHLLDSEPTTLLLSSLLQSIQKVRHYTERKNNNLLKGTSLYTMHKYLKKRSRKDLQVQEPQIRDIAYVEDKDHGGSGYKLNDSKTLASLKESTDYNAEEEEGSLEEFFFGEEFYQESFDIAQGIVKRLIELVIPLKPRVLTLKKAGSCLRILGKIWNLSEYPPTNFAKEMVCEGSEERLMDMEGYVDEYQYLHIEATNMSLTDIRIIPKHFVWLLSADLSGNNLTNKSACPVTKLPNLVALKLNENLIEEPYLPPFKHLQYLGLNRNKIKSLDLIYHPNLATLDLNYNQIQRVRPEDCWKHTKLTQLELRGNQLKTTAGIEYAALANLYLAENQITKLQGLEILVNLERLHLRSNPLSDLTGFSKSNIKLKYLNVRRCEIQDVQEIKHLEVLPNLKELIIMGNVFDPEPRKRKKKRAGEVDSDVFEEEPQDADDLYRDISEVRLAVLRYLPHLTRIDKTLVSKEEKKYLEEFD